jgi:hypothetical protein
MAKSKFAQAVDETGRKSLNAYQGPTDEADEKAKLKGTFGNLSFLVKIQ